MRHVDVVVIGAGISGLAVADSVHRSGLSVVVLEARDRTGGRLFGSPLDLGASWFWDGEVRVRALVDRLGVKTFPQHIAGDAMIDEVNGVQQYPGNPIDAPAHRFVSGSVSLAQALTRELPEGVIQLGHPVDSISDHLVVTANGESWQGKQVVIAVPPALAAKTIRMPNALPANVIDIARSTPVWMGDTIKVVAMYDKPFWRDQGLAGAAISRVGPLHEVHDLSGPEGSPAALFGFARSKPDSDISQVVVLAQLGRIFGDRAAAPQELLIQDWGHELWTNPAEASDNGGQFAPNYGLFGHAVYQRAYLNDRLHWSSTETASNYAGHIEGALEAAERTLAAINVPTIQSRVAFGEADVT